MSGPKGQAPVRPCKKDAKACQKPTTLFHTRAILWPRGEEHLTTELGHGSR
jgi:hypothetical protein